MICVCYRTLANLSVFSCLVHIKAYQINKIRRQIRPVINAPTPETQDGGRRNESGWMSCSGTDKESKFQRLCDAPMLSGSPESMDIWDSLQISTDSANNMAVAEPEVVASRLGRVGLR
jgi:hypothetical protein